VPKPSASPVLDAPGVPKELTRAEASAAIKQLADSFDVDLSNLEALEGTELYDDKTGHGLKVSGGTRYVRAYRAVDGKPTWLPEDQWHSVYSRKKQVRERTRDDGGKRQQFLTSKPLFTLDPPAGARLEGVADMEKCAICEKPMPNAEANQTVVRNGARARVTDLEKHMLGRHSKRQETIDIEERIGAAKDARFAQAIAAAIKSA
jgi:hypothetical protein